MIKQRKSMPLNAAEKKKLRAVEWTMSLSKEEKELLMEFCNENSKRELNDAYYGLDTVLSVHLNDDIGLITKIYNDLNIEGNKTKEYAAKGESYMKKIEENRNNIIEDYKKLKEEGKKENEIIKDIVFKYNITNNAAKNVISQYKKELKEKEEKSKIEEIVDYIWEEDKKEEVKEPVKEEPIKEVEEDPKDSPKGNMRSWKRKL